MSNVNYKKPNLFSAIGIGVGCIIGSGWLFASYYAAKEAGAISIVSWLIGASLALILALLLSEICTMFQKRALFSRLLTISHNNRDFGFVIAISNWLGLVITIPSEAEATVQYLSSSSPALQPYLFPHEHLSFLGILIVLVLLLIYGVINFWGIRTLTKANNFIATFKVIIPTLTALILLYSAFHPVNFIAYKNSIAPYGIGTAFSSVVTCGIFYAFYGFGTISFFSAELKNPKRNIPLALVLSIVICLVIYLLLQVAFIGALPTDMVSSGWHNLHFISPLAQLLLLLNLNAWAVVLYVDAMISPSGTASLYSGTAARNFTGMAKDKQMPSFFNKIHPQYDFSRRSLMLTLMICTLMVLFFRNWQAIMIVVTVFQLITCIAIPVAFYKLRLSEPNLERQFRMPFGKSLSIFIFILVSYLLAQAGLKAVILAFVMHVLLFAVYCVSFYKKDLRSMMSAFLSSWSIFLYLLLAIVYALWAQEHVLLEPIHLALFIVGTVVSFVFLIRQKVWPSHEQ